MSDEKKRSKAAPSVIDMAPDELKNFPELLLAYSEWKEDPITKMVFGMLNNLSKPKLNNLNGMVGMSCDSGIFGTAMYARHCGAQWMLDSAMSFDDEANPVKDIEADFGADESLKDE